MTAVPPPGSLSTDADDALLRAALAGAIGGILGGVVWAVILGLTNYEVGWIAWGIGWVVGWSMGRVTSRRSTELALVAAAIALMSLLLGKVLIQRFVTATWIEEEMFGHEAAPTQAAAWRLNEDKAFPPTIQQRLDNVAETDTMSDALWADVQVVADSHLASLSAEDRGKLLADYRTAMLADYGAWQQLRDGFSLWDVLWFGLAITTAWKMMKREPAAPEVEPEPA